MLHLEANCSDIFCGIYKGIGTQRWRQVLESRKQQPLKKVGEPFPLPTEGGCLGENFCKKAEHRGEMQDAGCALVRLSAPRSPPSQRLSGFVGFISVQRGFPWASWFPQQCTALAKCFCALGCHWGLSCSFAKEGVSAWRAVMCFRPWVAMLYFHQISLRCLPHPDFNR